MTKEQLLAMPEADYMNEAQIEFFKDLLIAKADDANLVIESARKSLANLGTPADPSDMATVEEDRQELTRSIARQNEGLVAIRQALNAINDGEFGWCANTGESIGLQRLLAQPTARLSVASQSIHEQVNRHYAAA